MSLLDRTPDNMFPDNKSASIFLAPPLTSLRCDVFCLQWIPYHVAILKYVTWTDVVTVGLPLLGLLYDCRAGIASAWSRIIRCELSTSTLDPSAPLSFL